jgi:rhamnosyltransferase
MKKLAVFVHYSRDNRICPNAMLYAEELTKYFDQVIIASNIIINSDNDKISCLCFEKNGYDIGYFYQTLELINAYDDYDMIGFFNDSNYIIDSLDSVFNWCFNNDLDFCGITDSYEKSPEIKNENQYHIQSHFLLFKNDAIKLLKNYFDENNINNIVFNEINSFKKRLNTIVYYEIGLSIFMRENNLSMGSFFKSKEFIKEHSNFNSQINIHMLLWKELVDNGYPLIKRKLVDISFNDSDYKALSKSIMHPMENSKSYVKQLNNIYTNTINLSPRKEFEDIC